MSYDFNADEVLKIAEQIERNGSNFYRKAAEKVSDQAEKKLLLNLAEMEDVHEKTFASLRKTISEKEKAATVFDPEDQTGMYLRSLADTRVFFEKELDFSSMKSILKYAIGAEKDSIIFYLGIKDAVPADLGKDKIEAIIKEEMSHIRILNREIMALKK